MFELRNYQNDCIESTTAALSRGVRRQLVVLPTGAGKTVVAAHLPQALKPKRVLFLAHREELLDQAAATFAKVYPGRSIGKEMGGDHAKDTDSIIVGSVPTLGPAKASRLRKLFGDDPQDVLVITDEAHHASSATYKNIYKFFGLQEGADTSNTHIGITATPFRGDNAKLTDIFKEIVYMRKLGDMILEGWLVDVVSHHVHTTTDISEVKRSKGDFSMKELSAAVNTPERNAIIVKAFLEISPQAKAVAFCVDIDHSEELARMFRGAGITAESITSHSSPEERRAHISAFKEGSIQVLTNCTVLTEGFDVPDIGTVIIARPTSSPVLYCQCLGRGMRLAEGKQFMNLIDMYDRTKHAPVHIDKVLNIPIEGCTYKDWKEIKDVVEEAFPYATADVIARALNANSSMDIMEKLESMNILEILLKIYDEGADTFIVSKTKLSWSKLADESYMLQSNGMGKLAIRVNALGVWELWRKEPHQPWYNLYTGDASVCFKKGDEIVAQHDKTRLYSRSASWRNKPASKSQMAFIKRLMGGAPIIVPITTRGKAGHLINSLLEGKRK